MVTNGWYIMLSFNFSFLDTVYYVIMYICYELKRNIFKPVAAFTPKSCFYAQVSC